MSSAPAVREGYIPFRDWTTWYRVVGERDDPGKLPLLTLHGGPGQHTTISRRYDEATAAIAETVHQGIAGSEWVMFKQSAHAEETNRYCEVLESFLSRIEQAA
jgi:hypothetical protein